MPGLACGVRDMKERTDKLIARRVGIEHTVQYSHRRRGTRAGKGETFGAQGAKMLESCEVSSLLYTVRPPAAVCAETRVPDQDIGQ